MNFFTHSLWTYITLYILHGRDIIRYLSISVSTEWRERKRVILGLEELKLDDGN